MPTPPKKKPASSQKSASSKTNKAPSLRAPKFPLSAKRTKEFIAEERRSHYGHSQHAAKLARKVKDAREEARDPMNADPTEVLKLFKPTERELEARGLPRNFLGGDGGEDDEALLSKRKRRCSNNTVLFMADFIS